MDEYLTLQTALDKRAKAANEIHQGSSSLCGPASFMYCIVKRKPEEYVRYVLNLARIGEGHLGRMLVKPNNACTYQVKPESEDGKRIDPVDWVALASLRDAYNDFVGMCTVKTPGGTTLYGDMAKWFTRTGWYKNVTNGSYQEIRCNTFGDVHKPECMPRKPPPPTKLDNLREIMPGNCDTCLMIDADILKGKVPWFSVMNHWIVLRGAIVGRCDTCEKVGYLRDWLKAAWENGLGGFFKSAQRLDAFCEKLRIFCALLDPLNIGN